MKIEDFNNVHDITSLDELEGVLKTRYENGINQFSLYEDNIKYPWVALMVNGDLAALHYFPHEGHPGFIPLGKNVGLEPGGFTTFYLSNPHREKLWIPNYSVIPYSVALTAAKEFFSSRQLPQSIEWFEL